MNQPSCTLHATTVLDYTSQGRALFAFGVQRKLEALLLAHLTNKESLKNRLEMRKLWPPKVKGVKNSKKNY